MKQLLKQTIPRFIVYDDIGNYADIPDISHHTDFLSIDWNQPRIVFNPINMPDDENTFEAFCKLVWDRGHNRMFVIDELHEHQTSSYVPPMLSKLVKQGRNRGIGFMGITQRLSDISHRILAQTRHVFSFYQFDPRDIEVAQITFGKEMADAITQLKWHEFVYWQGKRASDGSVGYDWKVYPPLKLQ